MPKSEADSNSIQVIPVLFLDTPGENIPITFTFNFGCVPTEAPEEQVLC